MIFQVIGQGPFPIEMLQVDKCYPHRNEDAILIRSSHWDTPHNVNVWVQLATDTPRFTPTFKKWLEFGYCPMKL